MKPPHAQEESLLIYVLLGRLALYNAGGASVVGSDPQRLDEIVPMKVIGIAFQMHSACSDSRVDVERPRRAATETLGVQSGAAPSSA